MPSVFRYRGVYYPDPLRIYETPTPTEICAGQRGCRGYFVGAYETLYEIAYTTSYEIILRKLMPAGIHAKPIS